VLLCFSFKYFFRVFKEKFKRKAKISHKPTNLRKGREKLNLKKFIQKIIMNELKKEWNNPIVKNIAKC
jgi:hypothetical protein